MMLALLSHQRRAKVIEISMSRVQKIVHVFAIGSVVLGLWAPASAFADASTTLRTNSGLEAKVRDYFADAPVMIPISKCESEFRQFDSAGSPLDGGSGAMIGLYQINARVHSTYAKSLGIDIYTVEGNLAYARKLYTEEGTVPWLSSASCWSPLAESNTDQASTTLHSTLKLGVVTNEVRALQQLLNKSGFTIAADGPGSPGQETIKFGTMTRSAVQKFQCAKQIVCNGDESTSGFGVVGAKTRAALLSIAN